MDAQKLKTLEWDLSNIEQRIADKNEAIKKSIEIRNCHIARRKKIKWMIKEGVGATRRRIKKEKRGVLYGNTNIRKGKHMENNDTNACP